MIIENMTHLQVKKELFEDIFEIKEYLNRNLDRVKKKLHKAKVKSHYVTKTFSTKRGNKYFITYRYLDGRLTYKIVAYVLSSFPKFFYLNSFDPIVFVEFTAHLFSRWRTRNNLDLGGVLEVAQHFFENNQVLGTKFLGELIEGVRPVKAKATTGVLLGESYLASESFKFKTFVEKSMLYQNQNEELADIDDEILDLILSDSENVELTEEQQAKVSRWLRYINI